MKLEIIINLIVVILTELIHVFCFKVCIDEKMNFNFKKIIVLILISIVNLINNLYNIMFFKIIISFILLVFLTYTWYKKNIKQTILLVL